jgi:hypothetical protein
METDRAMASKTAPDDEIETQGKKLRISVSILLIFLISLTEDDNAIT